MDLKKPLPKKARKAALMTDDQERYVHGRRASDDFNVRLTLVENAVIDLERDINDHRKMTERMCDTLDEIRLEISSAKGFLKAVVIGTGIFVVIVGALFTIQWLKVPV
jgi:hypothetical protein